MTPVQIWIWECTVPPLSSAAASRVFPISPSLTGRPRLISHPAPPLPATIHTICRKEAARPSTRRLVLCPAQTRRLPVPTFRCQKASVLATGSSVHRLGRFSCIYSLPPVRVRVERRPRGDLERDLTGHRPLPRRRSLPLRGSPPAVRLQPIASMYRTRVRRRGWLAAGRPPWRWWRSLTLNSG